MTRTIRNGRLRNAALTIFALLFLSLSPLKASLSPDEVWRALTPGKGVLIAKVKINDVEYFLFFRGANYGPKSSSLRDSPFRYSTLEAAQSVVRAKPDSVSFGETRSDHVIDDAQIMMRLTREERVAFGLEKEPNQ
jgi:hypothetical protein